MTYSLDGHGTSVLHVTPQWTNGRTLIRLGGELDIATAGHLPVIVESIAPAECPHLQLDLAGVTFIDAAGLTALIQADKLVRARGGRTTLRGVRPFARRIMEVTRLPLPIEDGDTPDGRGPRTIDRWCR